MIKVNSQLCAICKGRKLLCGRPVCPILERFRAVQEVTPLINREDIFGSSPPSIFVGEYGYPKVRLGPLVPPIEGETSYLDSPNSWENVTIRDVLRYRSLLVMGQVKVDVDVRKSERLIGSIQELALSSKPVDSEILLKGKPIIKVLPSEFAPPVGPRGALRKFEVVDNPKVPRKVDYVVSDELKAKDAIITLYEAGFDEYYIIRLLSAGLLGIRRKLVPTRWSITAVQDTIGSYLRKIILDYELIEKYELYFYEFLGNRYVVLLIPRRYSFELLEVWLKGSLFGSDEPSVIHDYEDFRGIRGYAEETSGAYYAARLSVLEYLRRRKKQASAIVFREVTPAYYAPVGVWQIRVGVRKALEKMPKTFEALTEALNEVRKILQHPLDKYLERSWLIKQLRQRSIEAFLGV
ncbi:Nre family DNA repair protein [Pyrococcus kukulkanii]|uniref:Nre family DNA repair protein n=1 Tax=Pyrococcus kukulkanii TaxID=1609559 RepID=UPI0035669EE6